MPHSAATQNREHSRCPAAVHSVGCSWQSPVTAIVPSFSFLSSLSHPTLSDDLLTALTVALKSTPFDFQGAQILSSLNKEAFNWIAVNYVLENFFKVKDDPAWEVRNQAEQFPLTNSNRDKWRDH